MRPATGSFSVLGFAGAAILGLMASISPILPAAPAAAAASLHTCDSSPSELAPSTA